VGAATKYGFALHQPRLPASNQQSSRELGNEMRSTPLSDSLSGLMKWLAKDPWRGAFLDVLDRHIGRVLDEYGISEFDELGGLIGLDWAMTLWGCAFEDFLTMDVDGAGNIVGDYLKRRGWKESARNKAYMTGLRHSVMSLYEVSNIQPGRSFFARDLIRGGEPVLVSERTATQTLKPWDRLAMRIVDIRGTMILGGGLLPFEHESSEKLIAALGRFKNRVSTNIPEIIDELGIDRSDLELDRIIGSATNEAELLRNLAPEFSLLFLAELLARIVNRAAPQVTNSDGEDIEFMRLVYRLAEGVTPAQVLAALDQASELNAVSATFWNWLETENRTRKNRKASGTNKLGLITKTDDGSIVLGTIELKSKTLELCVNSETRADRGRRMLEPLLNGLVGAPLVERQTLDQVLSEQDEHGSSFAMQELPSDEQCRIVHEAMDRHYRAQLDQPVPALGNISPRKAAKSKKGRDKLVVWLKLLENQTAKHAPEHPMSSYDVTWMWRELGLYDRRN
jgi:hypothetical protein